MISATQLKTHYFLCPFTTIASIAISLLISSFSYTVHALPSNNDSFCEELVSNSSKHLKSKDIHDAFQAALFSSLAYLRYEKIGDGEEEDRNLDWFPSEITIAKYSDHWPEKAAVHARMMLNQLQHFGQKSVEKVHRRLSTFYRKNSNSHSNQQPQNSTPRSSSNHRKQKQSWYSDHETYHIRWFLGDFQDDDGWHDVEVLLGESRSALVIAFRGSDTLADLLTNSQPMNEVPTSSRFYGAAMKGKVLGGMLAAFETVSHGRFVQITNNNTPIYNGLLGEGSLIHQTFLHACDMSEKVVTRSNGTVFTRCTYHLTHDQQHEDTLADILLETIFAAQERKKRVIITGHSLGAALAALLAYDHTLILHSQKSRLELRKWAKQERHRLTHPQSGLKHSLLDVAEYNHSKSVKQILAKPSKSKNVKDAKISQHQFNHPFHDLHSLKRHALLPKLITFGEPQFCDFAFISSLSNILKPLLKHRYWSFITLGGVDCKPDLVTELLKTLSSVLGRQFLGFDSVQEKKDRHRQHNSQYDTGAVISLTGDSAGGLQIDLQDAADEEQQQHEVLRLSPQQLRQLKANLIKEKNKSTNNDPMTIHPLLRQRHVFINSFSATSSVDAHALQHYLRGVLLLAVKHNDRQAYITASNWWLAIKRIGKGLHSSLPLLLVHDLSNATITKLNLKTRALEDGHNRSVDGSWRPQLMLRDVTLF